LPAEARSVEITNLLPASARLRSPWAIFASDDVCRPARAPSFTAASRRRQQKSTGAVGRPPPFALQVCAGAGAAQRFLARKAAAGVAAPLLPLACSLTPMIERALTKKAGIAPAFRIA
jgi:hypothetical protein